MAKDRMREEGRERDTRGWEGGGFRGLLVNAQEGFRRWLPTDRQTDRQTDRHKHTHVHTQINICCYKNLVLYSPRSLVSSLCTHIYTHTHVYIHT